MQVDTISMVKTARPAREKINSGKLRAHFRGEEANIMYMLRDAGGALRAKPSMKKARNRKIVHAP